MTIEGLFGRILYTYDFFQKCSRILKSLKFCERAPFDILYNLKKHFLVRKKLIPCFQASFFAQEKNSFLLSGVIRNLEVWSLWIHWWRKKSQRNKFKENNTFEKTRGIADFSSNSFFEAIFRTLSFDKNC